jgi:penicillin-binding protein 1B
MSLKKSKKARRRPRMDESADVPVLRRPRWRFSRSSVLAVLGGLLFLGFLYCIYLDVEIRSKFEGKRWALPARVYARPLEVFSGQVLDKKSLLKELVFLKYRSGKDAPGTYLDMPTAVALNTREFVFGDGAEPARNLTVRFDGKLVTEILDNRTGRELQLLRMEPAQIASIYPGHKEDRDLVRLDDVPGILLQTLIAVEDREFYEHRGIKISSIVRALVANIRAGGTVQGGSTLTQQLVKNFFLSNERSLRRKGVEAVMALLLEFHYDKYEILEAYINEVYLGQEGERAIHGFALASRFYFDRNLSELTVGQLALLVGLVNGPSYLNPQKYPDRARQRRDTVLNIMLAQEIITPETAQKARLAPLDVRPQGTLANTSYPAFIDFVKRQLTTHYREEDLRNEGLRIFTTFDPLVQQAAEKALSTQLERLQRRPKPDEPLLQGAAVVTSVDTGEVIAIVGDRDPRYAGHNRALDAHRPIGSLVKPAVYLTALQHETEFNPSTLIEDKPLKIKYPDGTVWEPANYDNEYHDQVPLFHGLIYSYNLATIRLGMRLGLDEIIETLRNMGLPADPPAYPSLLLGSLELSPLEVSQLYQTLAASGFYAPLRSVREVLTADAVRISSYPVEVRQTLEPGPVYQVNRLMQMVVEFGTGKQVGVRLPDLHAAGKTGTSNDLRDSWFAGFTGQHLAVVWVGRDDNKATKVAGASGALPVWIELMTNIDTRPLRIPVPQQIEYIWLDLASGGRSSAKCDNATQMPFIIGTGPEFDSDCGSWLKRLFN